jgi:hypothetical protein
MSFRAPLLIASIALSSCTVSWLGLRQEAQSSTDAACPGSLEVAVTAGHTTNSGGPVQDSEEKVQKQRARYQDIAERVLEAKHCVLSQTSSAEPLRIQVQRLEQVGALPQEWLTGLSFGLIPSWGTRPAEVRYTFSQGPRVATYVVDDSRVNHLFLLPFFWVSFVLPDEASKFEDALNDFTRKL